MLWNVREIKPQRNQTIKYSILIDLYNLFPRKKRSFMLSAWNLIPAKLNDTQYVVVSLNYVVGIANIKARNRWI
jgi:hypothetical protein